MEHAQIIYCTGFGELSEGPILSCWPGNTKFITVAVLCASLAVLSGPYLANFARGGENGRVTKCLSNGEDVLPAWKLKK